MPSPPPRSTRLLPRNFQRSRRTWSTRSPSTETDMPTSARSFSFFRPAAPLSLPRPRATRSTEISRSLPRNRARERSHARSTRRSPARNRLEPRRRQRSQGRTWKARVVSSSSASSSR
uniref:Uncharacterized protein n=1 Tax=Setaria viridis TaxID=4556 RepID=A0A4U6U616_SETVI|nr:hypothetical protein SEVIR_6G205950v2 [Setaria viridis]